MVSRPAQKKTDTVTKEGGTWYIITRQMYYTRKTGRGIDHVASASRPHGM